jgi:hypothetical protein
LPGGYVAEPRVHLGPYLAIDLSGVANVDRRAATAAAGDGGVATAA